ncbi:MAG: PTS sugar transporter subunit IIA, partial [Turicibacter sp.]
MIEKLITRNSVDVNVEVEDWVGAITEAGKVLLKNNYIEQRYIDGMISTVKEMGPYIVMVPGVAMPHARPEAGALGVGL